MLNKKLIVAIAASVLVFLGIYTFAFNPDEDPNANDPNTEEKQGDEKETSPGDNTENDEIGEEGDEETTPVFRLSNADTTPPVITLVGDAEVTIEVYTAYDDDGATALDDEDGDITDDINIVSTVNPNIVGTYMVTYNVSDSSENAAEEVVRTVYVVDTEIPLISLIGDNSYYHEVNTPYVDDGAIAVDNYDGNISKDIIVTGTVDVTILGEHILTYDVVDSEGNAADTVTRTVIVVDRTAPEINLSNTNLNMEIEVDNSNSNKYTEEYGTITDNYDADRAIVDTDIKYERKAEDGNYIEVTSIDTSIIAQYRVIYSATDSENNPADDVVRIVNVVDTTPPNVNVTYISNKNKRIEYNKKDDRVAVRFRTNEELDLNASSVFIAGENAVLEDHFPISNGFEYVYKIIVKDSTLEGQVQFVINAVDLAGNPADSSVFDVKNYGSYIGKIVIDKTAPNLGALYSTNELTNENITVTITSNEEVQPVLGWILSDDKLSMTKEFSANIEDETVMVKDLAGNEGNVVINITNIDKIHADIFVNMESGNVAKNHDVTIYATDENGIAHLRYGWFREDSGIKRGNIKTNLINDPDNPRIVIQPEDANGTYYLWIYVKDKAKNRKDINYGPFEFDNTGPIINSISGNPDDWTNNDVTLTINATDIGSGLHVEPYSFDDGGSWQASNTKVFTTNQMVNIRVRDSLENETDTIEVNIQYIDGDAPVIDSITGNHENWNKEDVTLTINATDIGSGLHVEPYSFDDGRSWQASNTKVFTTNQMVNIRVRDSLENETDTIEINIQYIDKDAPKIHQVWINGVNVGYDETIEADYTKEYEPSLATVIGRDLNNVPGEVTVELVKCYVNMGVPSSFIPEGDEGYYCRYRLTDQQGNSRTQKRSIKVVDTTAPKITYDNKNIRTIWEYHDVNSETTYVNTNDFIVIDNVDGLMAEPKRTTFRYAPSWDTSGGYTGKSVSGVDLGVPGVYRVDFHYEDSSAKKTYATKWIYVSVSDGTVYNQTQGLTYNNISESIVESSPEDVIYVGSGVYEEETITINKAGLILNGPNASISGAGKRNDEAVINKGRFYVTAENVTIDGFKIVNNDNSSTGSCIDQNKAHGLKIYNNIITGSLRGMRLGGYTGGAVNGVAVIGNLFTTQYGVTQTEDTTNLFIKNNIFNTTIGEAIGLGNGVSIINSSGGVINDSDDVEWLTDNNQFAELQEVINYRSNVINETQLKYYNNIQTAINAAGNNDIIRIRVGTYDEIVTISNKSVTIIGADKDDTKIKAISAYSGLNNTLTIKNVTIFGNNLSGQSFAGIFVSNGNVIIEDCNIVSGPEGDSSKRSIETQYNNTANITVRGTYISGYNSPYFNPSTGTLLLENNNFNNKGPSVDSHENVTLTGNENVSIGLFIGYNLLDEDYENVLAALNPTTKALAIAIHQNNPNPVVKLATNNGSTWGGFYTSVIDGELVITGKY